MSPRITRISPSQTELNKRRFPCQRWLKMSQSHTSLPWTKSSSRCLQVREQTVSRNKLSFGLDRLNRMNEPEKIFMSKKAEPQSHTYLLRNCHGPIVGGELSLVSQLKVSKLFWRVCFGRLFKIPETNFILALTDWKEEMNVKEGGVPEPCLAIM